MVVVPCYVGDGGVSRPWPWVTSTVSDVMLRLTSAAESNRLTTA